MHGGVVWIFPSSAGGYFNFTSRSWTLIPNSTSGNASITFHPRFGAAQWNYNNRWYMWGGVSGPGQCINDMWYTVPGLDFIHTWYYVNTSLSPGARGGGQFYTWVPAQQKLYIVGGQGWGNGFFYYQDTWVFDMVTSSWTQLAPPPDQRAGHLLVEFNGYLYLFGGTIRQTLNFSPILWQYSIALNRWSDLTNSMKGLTPSTSSFGYVISNQLLYITDGLTKIAVLDLLNLVWSQPVIDGYPPPFRCCQSAVQIGNMVWFWGGANGTGTLSDLYVVTLVEDSPLTSSSYSSKKLAAALT